MNDEVRTETYLRSDIINVLSALSASVDDILRAIQGTEIALYRAGYDAALQAVARSFAVEIEEADRPARMVDVTPRRRALRGEGR